MRMQAISGGQTGGKKTLQRGIIQPSGLPISVKTQQHPTTRNQVRIIARSSHYIVEVIYTKEPVQANVDPSFSVAIDLGVTNLAAITANCAGFIPDWLIVANSLLIDRLERHSLRSNRIGGRDHRDSGIGDRILH